MLQLLGPLMMWNTLLISVAVLGVTLRVLKVLHLRSKLPPGPPGIPILGNLLQLPTSRPWLTFDKWREQYGKYKAYISSCNSFTQ